MAHDLFRGRSPKNFAIQGHPPLHSFEYVMAGGGYVRYAPPARPWRPRPAENTTSTGAAPPPAYVVSPSDWEASVRWMGNLAENISAVRRETGDKLLSADEVGRFTELWRRWLLFGNKVGAAGGLLSPALLREWSGLLGEAQQLYERYRLLGLPRVAPPYVGELAVVVMTLPAEASLADLVVRLRDAARAAERLLDNKAPWWAWRKPGEPRRLAVLALEAKLLAKQIDDVAKTLPGQGTRDSGAPVYLRVAEILKGLQDEASLLYEGREPRRAPGQDGERGQGAGDRMRGGGPSLWWLVAAGGAGYLGMKWLTGGKKQDVAGNGTPGYHPGVSYSDNEPQEEG